MHARADAPRRLGSALLALVVVAFAGVVQAENWITYKNCGLVASGGQGGDEIGFIV